MEFEEQIVIYDMNEQDPEWLPIVKQVLEKRPDLRRVVEVVV